jgi:hypothetical protein
VVYKNGRVKCKDDFTKELVKMIISTVPNEPHLGDIETGAWNELKASGAELIEFIEEDEEPVTVY